jgi:hypothetical protein
MKRDKIIYWTTTGLFSAMMLMSGVMYLTRNPQVVEGFKTSGFPDFLIVFLGTAKLLGALALILPMVWNKVKEWAYAGFVFNLLGAVWAHISTNTNFVSPLIFLVVLGISYWAWNRINGTKVIS